jgi:DNA primase catalytic core
LHRFEQNKRQVLDRVDIVELVSEHVALKRSGRRLVGLCPFHSEKTPSFTVSPDYGSFKCFGCGKSGDVFSFVQYRENIPFVEALTLLADRAGVELSTASGSDSTAGGPSRSDLIKVNEWAAKFFRSRLQDEAVGESARAYVVQRGISDSIAERFELGLAVEGGTNLVAAAKRAGFAADCLLAADLIRRGDSGETYDTFRNRLMFPIRDASHRVIGFGGRTLVDDRAKYLNTAQNALFDKGRHLYGIHLAREAIAQRGRAVVVEGYTDCVAAHQAGVTEVVAALGTALTESHVDLLRRYADTLILLFDSDRAGEAAAERAIRVAVPRCVSVRLARIPEGEDPSEFLGRAGSEAFSDVLNRAIGALEFKWKLAEDRYRDNESDSSRREAIVGFLRLVAEAADTQAVDAIQRGLLVNQVAHLLRMDRSEVDGLMVRLRSRRAEAASSVAQGVSPQRQVPRDSEQAAWIHVLEVLLNEPAVWSADRLELDASRIASMRDRGIAGVVFELVQRLGEFHLEEVTAHFQDAEDVARVTELAELGLKRKNYEETFLLACERIREGRILAEVERNKELYFTDQTSGETTEESRELVAGIINGAKTRRHYVPRRLHHKAAVRLDAEES